MLDVLGVAGLMALGALVRFPLPFTPVPVTMQTFIALIAGFAAGPRRAAAGVVLYAVLGWLGVPLFAVSSGSTMGYIAAMAMAPYVATAFKRPMAGFAAATMLIYALGSAWLSWWGNLGMLHTLALGVFPFVAGDLAKIMAARAFVRWLRLPA